MKKRLATAVLIWGLGNTHAATALDWDVRVAEDRWTWVSDYVATWVTYQLLCEPTRVCQVGTGISFRGKPRGSKTTFRGDLEVTAIGIGALQIRAADDKGPVSVAIIETSLETIGVYQATW